MIELNDIRFASGKATVTFDLEKEVDPMIFESAVCKSVDEIRFRYNDIDCEVKGQSIAEYERKAPAVAIGGIGIIAAVAFVIIYAIISAL
jgi:hypothetical protein